MALKMVFLNIDYLSVLTTLLCEFVNIKIFLIFWDADFDDTLFVFEKVLSFFWILNIFGKN